MRAPPTPSSLKWLITRHARLEGEIAKLQAAEDVRQADVKTQLAALERQLKCAMAHERRQQTLHTRTMDALKADLAATGLLLKQHEVGVDPAIIKPVRSQDNLSLTAYGHLTRLIYRYLKDACGSPRTATQTAAFVACYLGEDSGENISFSDLRYRVRKRLQNLAWQGKITRVENQQGSIEGRWCLKRSQWSSFEQETPPLDDGPASNLATSENDLS